MPEFIIPNCAITLTFNEGPARFDYHCTNMSPGWQVRSDGSIHLPSKDRIIQIRLRGFPVQDIRFAGFQISATGEFPNDPDWTPVEELHDLGIQGIHTPHGYPPPHDSSGLQSTPGPLTIDFGREDRLLFYRLAVVVGNSTVPHWDDPKIYDDGTG
jgi:hypothetical protein